MADTTLPNLPPWVGASLPSTALIWTNVNGADYRVTAGLVASNTTFNQPATNENFVGNGAVIQRFNDRVFIGGATANDGAFPNIAQDWLTQFQVSKGENGTIDGTNTAILNNNNPSQGGALLAGAQTKYVAAAGYGIANMFFLLNNGAAGCNGFGRYGEAHHLVSAALQTVADEIDVSNWVHTYAQPTPFSPGIVNGLQVVVGSGLAVTGQFCGDKAISTGANATGGTPPGWQTGLSFESGSINDGAYGYQAIQLAPSHRIAWWADGSHDTFNIIGCPSVAANTITLNVDDTGFSLQNASAVDFLNILPATGVQAGLAVAVAALGTPPAVARGFVTDSTVAASGNFGAAVVGGGSHVVPVYWDTATWRIG